MQGERLRKPTVSLRLSTALLQEIDALSAKTGARTRTEFIERALTEYVEEIRESKVIVVRPWTSAKARAAVLRFLKDRPSAYVSGRKVSRVRIVSGTSAHRAQSVYVWGMPAACRIDKPWRLA
jgi:predicted transcriptional regulator